MRAPSSSGVVGGGKWPVGSHNTIITKLLTQGVDNILSGTGNIYSNNLVWLSVHFPTLLIRLEVHSLHHYKIMPVNLGVGHTFFLPLLLLLLPFTLLELRPFNTVPHLLIKPGDKLLLHGIIDYGHFKSLWWVNHTSKLQGHTWSSTSLGFSDSLFSFIRSPLGGIRI